MQSHVKVVLHNLLWDAVNESVANIQLAALHNNSVIQFSEVLKFFRGVSNATLNTQLSANIATFCNNLVNFSHQRCTRFPMENWAVERQQCEIISAEKWSLSDGIDYYALGY